MTSSNFATQNPSFDDIVFEGRNREYGAYLLRKIYTRNLFRGVVTGVSLFLLLVCLPLFLNKFFPKEFIVPEPVVPKPVTNLTIIELPELPKEIVQPQAENKPEVAPATPAAPTTRITVPVVSTTGTTTMPEVTLPPGIEPGLTNSQGNGGTSILPETGTGTAGLEGVVPENKIFEFVEVKPEFPGGEAAMMQYLSKNIRYPSLAERNKLEGLVVVQFVVNEEGRISGISFLKKLGGGTDEEAMRVIKGMPVWKAGMQNGKAVKVRYTLPIRFTLKK